MTTASLLPNGKQQFIDNNGQPISGGSVYFYIPNTTTPKDTWQDAGQATLNTNPVVLDDYGEAVIYGYGIYRQILKDASGNQIWDQQTADYNSVIDSAISTVTTLGNARVAYLASISSLQGATSTSLVPTTVSVAGYYAPADGGGGIYVYDSSDTTSADNGGTIIVDASSRRWKLQTLGKPVSVKQFGAKGDGTTDDAPALRNAVANCNDLVFPASTYLLGSTVASPIATGDPACILIESTNDFRITGEPGAILTCSNAAAFSHHIFVYGCSNFSISGLTHLGNRSGLTTTQETSPYLLFGCVDFVLENAHATGDWTGYSAFCAGDWLVDGIFRNCVGDAVGQGFDVAFLLRCKFEDCTFTGAATYSGGSAGGVGVKGFSIIYDVPNSTLNNSGVTFSNTNHVDIDNLNVTNFGIGVLLTSGTNIQFSGGSASGNPGISPSQPGVGILIGYNASGDASSVGFPVARVSIEGMSVGSNASAQAGFGIFIDGENITNSDIMSGFIINGNTIYNNNATGFSVGGQTHVTAVILSNNIFSGPLQTTPVDSGFATLMNSHGGGQNAVMKGNIGYFAPIQIPALPGGTGIGNIVVNTAAFPYLLVVQSQTASYDLHVNDGTVDADAGATGSGGKFPSTVMIPPGTGVYFATAVPTGWFWQPLF